MARRKRSGGKDMVPPLEWAASILGGLIVLAMIIVIGREAIVTPPFPVPSIEVKAGRMEATPGGYVVGLMLVNAGAATAAGVQVEGTLKQGDADVETSSATINYVPGFSRARGGLIFQHDPRRYRLELRVTGYQVP